ncbi:MAG: hypothetical protein QOE90_2143 [Thermoplasmata archaeon]|jgi:hypothetical protein|nr:hypothetical protein [Thermoplasmata archaeon]
MGKAMALACIALALGGCVVAAPSRPPAPPAPAPALAPATLRAEPPAACPDGRAVATERETRVSVDNGTAVAAMALASATGEALAPGQLTDTANVTRTSCLAQVVAADGSQASALLVVTRTCERTVRLGADAAMGAIALARSGIPVRVADVLVERSGCETRVDGARNAAG